MFIVGRKIIFEVEFYVNILEDYGRKFKYIEVVNLNNKVVCLIKYLLSIRRRSNTFYT